MEFFFVFIYLYVAAVVRIKKDKHWYSTYIYII